MCWPVLLLRLTLSPIGPQRELGPCLEMNGQTLLASQLLFANLFEAQFTFPTHVLNAKNWHVAHAKPGHGALCTKAGE